MYQCKLEDSAESDSGADVDSDTGDSESAADSLADSDSAPSDSESADPTPLQSPLPVAA